MSITKVENSSLSLPPAWLSRISAGNRALGTQPEVRKMLGEPVPRQADMSTLAPHIAAMFKKGGLLDRIRRKLAYVSQKKGGQIIAAHNTIAAVDPDDNVYVGVEFLESCGGEEDVIAGILAHEWGHMVSELPRDADFSGFDWDDLFAMRRDEEAGADAYAGRALYLLGYSVEPLVNFLGKLEAKRVKNDKVKTVKYYPIETRAEILRQGFAAEKRIETSARKLLASPGYRHPSFSKLIAIG